jgi:PAS domain S-box-containing protein/diguanylate cyclase (GGDEF)-like protein
MCSFDDSEIYRSILESLPDGVCVVDTQKRIVLWSDGAERITGYLRHEVIGRRCIAEPLLHCDQPGCEFCTEGCPLARAMKTSRGAEGTGFLHHKSGHEIPVSMRAVPVHNQHGSIVGAVETFQDLQQAAHPDRCETRGQLPEAVDPVTGTATHVMAELHLRRALEAFQKFHTPFGVMLIRVEKLPHFRASLGPEAAASFLRVVARTLEGALWITDFVGRWSDDEFLIILSNCHADAIRGVRERVRHTIAGEGIEWWGERRSLPVSIGEASAEDQDTVDAVLERAQKSLQSASDWRTNTAAAGSDASSES